MNDELHRHLDGEPPARPLPPETRAAADDWGRMLDAFRTAAPGAPAPPWLEDRVMAQIDALPARSAPARALAWLLRPATIRISPLTTGLAAAALVLLALFRPGADADPDTVAATGDAVVYVQFVLDAPAATSVAVAGDFSAWAPEFELADPDGDGIWTGRVPVEPGVHSYMFLIDGTVWETDPRAERYQDDGFGNRNAVLAVAGV